MDQDKQDNNQPIIMVVSRGGYLLLDEPWATQDFYSWNCFNCEHAPWHYYVAGKELGKDCDIIYEWYKECEGGYIILCKECFGRFYNFAKERGATFDRTYDYDGGESWRS
jgi:hypothetical protein